MGYIITQFKLPVWIDEGIGMQVDYRKKYIIDFESVSPNETKEININRNIWDNQYQPFLARRRNRNYQISRALVAKILSQNFDKSLYSMLRLKKERVVKSQGFQLETMALKFHSIICSFYLSLWLLVQESFLWINLCLRMQNRWKSYFNIVVALGHKSVEATMIY